MNDVANVRNVGSGPGNRFENLIANQNDTNTKTTKRCMRGKTGMKYGKMHYSLLCMAR